MAEKTGRQILIAVDSSENAKHAFEWLQKELYHEKDTILICHVPEAPKLPTFSFRDGLKIPAAEWQKSMQEQIEKTSKLHNDFEQECIIKKMKYKCIGEHVKSPGEGIIAMANREHADIIVMGTRGLSAIRRTFVGSVSDYVIHHSAVPVVVVPPAKN